MYERPNRPVSFTVRLTAAERELVDRASQEEDLPRSHVVRRALLRALSAQAAQRPHGLITQP